MLATIVILFLAGICAWLGWRRRIRSGLLVSTLLPAIIGLIASFTISLPGDAGGPWLFIVSFVILAVASLIAFGLAVGARSLVLQDKPSPSDEKA